MKIAFYQTPYDSVTYTLENSEEIFSLGYYKFKEYLYKNFFIKDIIAVQSELDRFSTVIIHADGSHTLYEFDFSTLTRDYEKLKKMNQEKKEDNKSKIDKLFEKSKARLNAIFKETKDERKIPWLNRLK